MIHISLTLSALAINTHILTHTNIHKSLLFLPSLITLLHVVHELSLKSLFPLYFFCPSSCCSHFTFNKIRGLNFLLLISPHLLSSSLCYCFGNNFMCCLLVCFAPNFSFFLFFNEIEVENRMKNKHISLILCNIILFYFLFCFVVMVKLQLLCCFLSQLLLLLYCLCE